MNRRRTYSNRWRRCSTHKNRMDDQIRWEALNRDGSILRAEHVHKISTCSKGGHAGEDRCTGIFFAATDDANATSLTFVRFEEQRWNGLAECLQQLNVLRTHRHLEEREKRVDSFVFHFCLGFYSRIMFLSTERRRTGRVCRILSLLRERRKG